MIKRFNELLFDQLLNETTLFYSNEFSDVLKTIDSKLATDLSELGFKNIPKVAASYINLVPDSIDEVSFIPGRKVDDEVNKLEFYKRLRYPNCVSNSMHNPEVWNAFRKFTDANDVILERPSNNDTLQLIEKYMMEKPFDGDIAEYGYFQIINGSYEPEDGVFCIVIMRDLVKIESNSVFFNKFYNQNRNKIKIGRLVRSILKTANIEFKDSEIEDFVNKWKAKIENIKNINKFFELVSGEDITHWYNEDNYEEQSGTIGASCMRYDTCEDYFSIYTKSDSCKLLILKSPNKENTIVGRAIVWKTNEGFTFMDRVYAIKDSYIQVFRDYAKANGWYYKAKDNSQAEELIVKPDGTSERIRITVDVANRNELYSKFPYVDTLKYYYFDDDMIANFKEEHAYWVELTDTEGSCDTDDYGCKICGGDNKEECDDCGGGGYINEDCEVCDGKGKVDCEYCDNGKELCPDCDGSGKDDEEECSNCDGSGNVDCPECEGVGKIDCVTCNGDGEVRQECNSCEGSGSQECEGKVHTFIRDIN